MEKDAIEAAGTKAINEILSYIKATAEFTIEQAPDVAQQFLAYEAWRAEILMWVLIVPTLLMFVLGCYYVYKVINDSEYLPGVVMCWMATFVFGLRSIKHYAILKQIEIAPKVFLLEKLATLMK